MKRGKKYVEAAKTIDRGTLYDVADAVSLVKKTATAKFDETIEAHIRTGCDGRHADQQIRGAVVLPHGTGKAVKVLVIAKGEKIDEAKAAGAAVVSTGRSDYPNQVNNVLCFPGLFRGVLDARASDVNDEMKVAAAYAIAGLVSDEELTAEYILPAAFDPRVKDAVAKAVAEAARKSGVARI